jgi:ubiquinone/menaquinone biosynthesis C-methylase UbiE
MDTSDPTYALAQREDEYERLGRQAQRDDGLTERLFRAAGIGPGMRVLDVGCGAGHVSTLVANLVGSEGSVIGIDREPDALEHARQHVVAGANISFVQGDFRERDIVDGGFDAVVGRYVLMYQSDPTDAVSRLATKVRGGGVLAFHEMDIPSRFPPAGPWPESDLADELGQLILKVWVATGTQLRIGARLPSIFAAAGLEPSTDLLTEALVGVGREWAAGTVGLLRSMEPVIRELGLADLDALDLDTAIDRLIDAAPPPGPVGMGPVKVGAWARREDPPT